MSEENVVMHCAPTLAGLKTGSLFLNRFKDISSLQSEIKNWNSVLNKKGIYFLILRSKDNKALIYVYRKSYLEQDLSRNDIKEFLNKNGYFTDNMNVCLNCLSERLQKNNEFPHEIGVFLSYPLSDIKAFIEHKGRNCNCVGYWKAYTNENEALKTFAKYRKCTDIYCKKQAEGFDITRLTVAV